jgi:hypothetical protein
MEFTTKYRIQEYADGTFEVERRLNDLAGWESPYSHGLREYCFNDARADVDRFREQEIENVRARTVRKSTIINLAHDANRMAGLDGGAE